MEKINLYKYDNEDGSITVTPNRRSESDTVHCYRLIADDGMLLTDGKNAYKCIDTNEVDKYTEIIDTNYEPEETNEKIPDEPIIEEIKE